MSFDNKNDGLQPPQSLDAESAVLGVILAFEDGLAQAIEILKSERMFYMQKHRYIFGAMLDLYRDSEPTDITTVANRLDSREQLETIGGRVYLVELAEYITSSAHIESHAKIIHEKFMTRELIQASNNILRECYNSDMKVENLLDSAESKIFDLSETRSQTGFVDMKSLVHTGMKEIDHLCSEESDSAGLETGFTSIDEMTLGFNPGELIIIAGRPSMGKTSLALNIAEYVATRKDKPVGVGIFSLEMSSSQLILRMLCGRARLNQQRIRAGKLKDSEWPSLNLSGQHLANAPMFIDDSGGLTLMEMRGKARRLKAQHNIGLLIVDYIQIMGGDGRTENRQQEISLISRGLKQIAKELELPVIGISQLSRQVEQRGGEKRPHLSDLRESGAIEQDADIVMFVYREEFYLSHLDKTDTRFAEVEGQAEIIIAKQRNGPTGKVNLAFIKEFASFENLTWRPEE